MIDSDPSAAPNLGRSIVIAQYGWVAVLTLVAVILASIALFGVSSAACFAVVLFVVIAGIAARGLTDYPLDTFGAANIVTTIRAGGVAFLAGLIVQPAILAQYDWLIFVVAVTVFAMDGLDGYLARRGGLETPFGARFDMEIDALLGAVLSIVLLRAGITGPEILILGFMRYTFVGASFVLPWLNGPLPDSFRRKTVCVIQIAALIFLICPLAPTSLLMPVSIGATAILIWSFAIDTLWLKRAAA